MVEAYAYDGVFWWACGSDSKKILASSSGVISREQARQYPRLVLEWLPITAGALLPCVSPVFGHRQSTCSYNVLSSTDTRYKHVGRGTSVSGLASVAFLVSYGTDTVTRWDRVLRRATDITHKRAIKSSPLRVE